MATGRITRKVLDYISNINKEAKQMQMAKDLKKEVETGKHGTQKYVVKQGENKGKIL
jgi:translation initiation factor 1 (eIF-1/SUI1)|tara:strand:- start:161 stop:331 length:171 start_codon:yes stop_codon:yes gene_type:complete